MVKYKCQIEIHNILEYETHANDPQEAVAEAYGFWVHNVRPFLMPNDMSAQRTSREGDWADMGEEDTDEDGY